MIRATSLVFFAALTAVVGIAELSNAAIFRYRASGNWTLITDGASPGWGPNPVGVGSSLPGAGDDARVNFGNNTVTVDSSVPTVSRVQIGVDESGNVDVNSGGVLSASLDILAGNNNANATGTLNVNDGGVVNVGRILWSANDSSNGNININTGGQVNVASHLWWGVTGTANVSISGTLNQTGGILGLGTNDASTPTGGTAQVTISDGGLLALNNISGAGGLPSIQPGSQINITGTGQLTLPNDFVGLLGDYEAAGKIVGNGGASALTIDLTKNPGFTTAYLIPEPAGMALLGAGFAAMLLRKRR